MTISTAERREQETRHHEAIMGGTFYLESKDTEAIDALVGDIKGLSDEAYEDVGGEVLGVLTSVVRREPIKISETVNPERFKEIAQELGHSGASAATEFMEAVSEKLDEAEHVPYAGEDPSHVVLPFGTIPGYGKPGGGGMHMPVLAS